MRLLLTRLLFSLMLIATFNKAKAQCNPHDLKVLESTRISFADEVTKGSSAEIFVVVHSADAQYKATDENGMVYNAIPSATYPSTLSINVGVINAPRTFTITALKGNCEYELPDVVTIGAQESARLSLRKIDEYCQHQGAVMYQVIGNGENPADYEYTWQMPNGTWSLPLDPTGVSSLSAGNYRFKATHKTDPAKTFEAAIDIISRVQPIVFDLETYGQVCDDKATIEVKVTSGLYPLYFSLYRAKNDGTFDLVRPSQTSPFFRDIERNDAQGNTYQVRVNDFCGGAAGFGNATTKSITIGRFERFAFNQIQGPGRTGNIGVQIQSIWGCDTDKMSITPSWEANFNPQKVLWDDSSIYPMTFNFTLTSPSGIVYPVTFTYNNKTELFEGLILARYRNGIGPWYFALKDNSTLRFPKEEGNWRVTNNSYTLCGQTYPLPDFDKYVGGMQHYMEQYVDLILDRDACGRPYLAARDKWYEFKDSYLVLEEYPNCYNPAEDGFVKNPRFGNGWVKGPFAYLRHDSGLVVVSKDKICLGTYKMKFVNQCGNEVVRTRILTDPLVVLPEKIDDGLRINIHESCSSDKIGLRIRTGYESLFMQEVKLLSFDGDATQLPADVQIGQTLPEHYRIANAIYYLPDTPVGRYVFEATVADNTCSVTMKESVEVRPEPTVTYTLQPDGCNYKLVPSATKVRLNDNVTYVLQWYDPIQGIWTAAEKETYHNNKFSFITEDRFYRYITVPLNGNYRSSGKFRIVRAVFTKKDDGILECLDTNNAQEFEIPGPTDPEKKIKIKQILGIRCASNTYQVAVIAEGGKPPFTYSITNIGGTSQNISSDDDNMFFNITPADGNTSYVFRVEDACGEADADAVTPAQFSANFKILANQPNYCTGVKGILSVPNIHPKITYRWYRADNPSATLSTSNVLKIDALSVDDFNNDYEVDISSTFAQTDVATCLNKTLSYRFIEGNSAIEDISSKGVDKQMCALQTENLNLNLKQELFPSVTTDGGIMEINGSIQIPHPYDVNLYKYVGSTLTVTYTIKNECGLSATATSTLTLNKQHPRLYSERDVPHFTKCSGTVTSVAELETFIKGKYLLNPSVVFQWFANSDMTTPLTFPITANKAVYFRLSVPGLYCESAKPHTLNINFFNDPTGGRTAHIEVCEGTNVSDMIKYILVPALAIHNSLRHNLKIYSYDRATGLRTPLHGDYLMLDPSLELQYRYEVDGCTSADYYPFSYTLIKGPQVENRLKLYVCSGEEITGAMAYAKLREKYPNATTIDIRLTNGNYYVKDSSNEKLERYVSYSYTLQETNICRSLRAYLWFEDAEKTQKPAQANLTLCTGATLSEVKGALPGNNVHIYKDDVLVTDLTEPISAMATYRYTNTNANQCESDKSTVLITLQPLTTIVGNTDILLCETEAINQTITLGGTFSGMGTPTGLPMGITASFTANEITLSGVPTVVGTYTYSIPLTGTCGTHSVVTATIRVKAKPQKPIIVEHTPATCTSVQMLKISNYNPLATYHNLPAGSSIDNQGVIVGLTDATSTYGGIIAQVEGCESEPSDTFTILAKLPTADAPSVTNQTLCSSTDTATFVATPTAGHTLRWYDTATSPTHLTATPTVSRNVTVKTIVTKYVSQVNAEGCESGRVAVTITVTPRLTITAPTIALCQTAVFTLQGQPNETVTYTLSNGTSGNITLNATGQGTVQVTDATQDITITATDNCGTVTATAMLQAYCSTKPLPQFPTTNNAVKVMNDVTVTRLSTTVPHNLYYAATNLTICGVHTHFPANYLHLKATLTAPHTVTYTFDKPVNDVEVWVMVMGNYGDTRDEVDFTTNGGATTLKLLSGCADLATITGTKVIGYSGGGLINVAVRVSAAQPFTQLTLTDPLINDSGRGHGSLIEICPESVRAAQPLEVTQHPKNQTVCQGESVTFTSVPRVLGQSTAIINYTWQSSTNGTTWTDIAGAKGSVTSSNTVSYTTTATTALTGMRYRVIYDYTEGCKTYSAISQVATVTVKALPTPTINVVTATCGNSGSVTITNYDAANTYTFSDAAITRTGATITGFVFGTTYTMTVSNGTCTETTSFVVNTTCTIDAVDDPLIEVDALSTHRTSVISILDNDVLGTLSATTANVTITQLSTTDARVNIDPATGKIRLTNSTVPTGIYTITYRICEEVNDTPCDTATITVKVRNIKAENDVVSYIAGVIADNILYNDTYNNEEAFDYYNDLKITITSPLPSGVTVEPEGDFKITESVRSGVYTFTYQICSEVLPDVCDSATVTLTVRNIISAYDDDDGDYLNGYSVVPNNTIDIFENDRLNSHFVTSQTVTISSHTALPTGVTIDANGIVTIGNDTPTGVHSFTYVLCEKDVTPSICDSAKVLFTVKNINADNDDFEVSAGGNTGSVLNNDKYDGEFLSSTTSVTLTPIGTLPSGISLDPITGIVRVASGTPSGNYSFNYKICSKVVTSLCDDATVTITVENGIVAEDDDLGPVVSGGTTTQTVISNDKLNGTPVVIGTGVGQVTLTPLITPTGITIDATNGKVTVGTNVSSGVYTLTYKICENGATPDNCDEATVTITVQNGIVAEDDDLGPVVSGGTTTQTVITNDRLNGTPVVIGTGVGQVTLTPLITPTGITLNGDGKVTVGTNVSSGVYTLTYKICENGATPDNCDEATVTITVQNGIVAEDDNLGTVVSGGTTTQTVISNDKLNGTPVVIGTGVGQVTLTPIITPTGITIDATNGKVSVGNNVPSGVYTLTYKICENGATPDNCDTATVTITVLSSNTVLAISDINNTYLNTSVSGNVSTNDEDPQGDALEFSLLTASNHQGHSLVFNSDGTYVFTPKEGFTGVVVYEYEVCDKGMPRACATATLTIGVFAQPHASANTVFANDDAVRTKVGTPVLISVLANDIDVEGDTFEITSHPSHTSYGSLSLSNGKLTYTPNAGYVGVDSFTYTICDNRTTDKACSTATVRVLILSDTSSNTTFANDDAYNGDKNRVISGNVLSNDVDLEGNGQTTTLLSGATKGVVSLNADGTFSYKPNMGYVGPDSFTYKLCDDGTPEACAVATVYLTVNEAESIVANNDDFTNTPIRNMVGGVLGSVLTNDTYLGVPISSGQVSSVTLVSDGGLVGVTLDGSGHLTIPQGATEGTYTLTYEVCEKSKGSCATAEIYVRIIKGCPLNFYNGLSNNEDGTNDGFVIDGVECYPKNKVRIYNRWGVKVFETESYNNKERLFRGISNGRVTVDADKKLPQGTYYYVLEYTDASNQTHSEAGWLYIKR
ncbi:Ig-like domain-containing protein [Capnocytophaga canimorsus]|uniref:Ig-like domain-containing protein n=1 Tax=Capnocytophaga canimorsus TaxID=28188 RepID=UPI0037D86127